MPSIYRDLAVVGIELLAIVITLVLLRLLIGTTFRRLARSPRAEKHRALLTAILRKVTMLLVLIFVVAVLALGGINGYLAYRGGGIYPATSAAIVLMLNVIGINPFPLLAGAGIIGIVVGFGAQPVINDVVSGLFILFREHLPRRRLPKWARRAARSKPSSCAPRGCAIRTARSTSCAMDS